MHPLRQLLALLGWNIRSMPHRSRSALVAVTGFFAVVLVFVAVLSVRDGLLRSVGAYDTLPVAIVYSDAGDLDSDALRAVAEAPGVAQGPHGPRIAGAFVSVVEIPRKSSGLGEAFLTGIGPEFADVNTEFHLVAGRMFTPGLDEIVVGRAAERLYRGLSVGDVLHEEHRNWRVVGIVTNGGGRHDSELYGDLRLIQAMSGAGDRYSTIGAMLTSRAALPAFRDALAHNPRLSVSVEMLSDFDASFSKQLDSAILAADAVITVLMAIGAIFGALNVMFANVASRSAEIATLRTLGFGRGAILCAVLFEAMSLAAFGGLLGASAAFLAFNGYEASTSLSGELTAFTFSVTPAAIAAGLALSLSIGFLGGLFPSLQAARLPLARALRDA